MKDKRYQKDYNQYIRRYAMKRHITQKEARTHRIPILVLEWYKLRDEEEEKERKQ